MPGFGQIPEAAKSQVNDRELLRLEAIINSMTPTERAKPDLIKGSRKRRIALGSGTQVQDVNKLLKQYDQMNDMMKKISSKGGLMKLMRSMGGKMPPGMMPKR